MKKYIVVIQIKDNSIVHKVDITGKSERTVDAIENGMNINLNHNEFFTKILDESKLINSINMVSELVGRK